MENEQKQVPGKSPDKKEQEAADPKSTPTPEILHIGSGGAFTESEGDVEDEQEDQAGKTKETPY